MSKVSSVNPFAAAKKQTSTASQPKGSVFVASAVLDSLGKERFSAAEVKAAVENYVNSSREKKEAEAMMTVSKSVIDAFGVNRFCTEWNASRRLPENPRIVSESTGGKALVYIIQDKSILMSDEDKNRLTSIVGAKLIDSCVETKNIFSLNTAVVEQEITVTNIDKNGKKVQKTDTVLNIMAAALQERFADHPDLLATLFTVKPVQQTVKGLIGRGLDLVHSGPDRLAEFLSGIKAPLSIKPIG